MKVYNEVKKIATNIEEVKEIGKSLQKENPDLKYVDWLSTKVVNGLTVYGDKLLDGYEVVAEDSGDYYISKENYYKFNICHGYIYFKTDIPNQYVKVYYSSFIGSFDDE